jgi:hypothetical protein
MFCGRNFGPLATLPTMPQIAHRQVHATGEKGCRQEQNRRRLEQNKSAKNTLLPSMSILKLGMHFQMRRRLSIHILSFEYKEDSKM